MSIKSVTGLGFRKRDLDTLFNLLGLGGGDGNGSGGLLQGGLGGLLQGYAKSTRHYLSNQYMAFKKLGSVNALLILRCYRRNFIIPASVFLSLSLFVIGSGYLGSTSWSRT